MHVFVRAQQNENCKKFSHFSILLKSGDCQAVIEVLLWFAFVPAKFSSYSWKLARLKQIDSECLDSTSPAASSGPGIGGLRLVAQS